MDPFEKVWKKIKKHAGETFKTKRGYVFKYQIIAGDFYSGRTNYKTSKSDFRKAYALMPISKPSVLINIVRGPSYVWVVLTDKRIVRKIK